MFRTRRKQLVRFWLTLIVVGMAMIVGSFLAEICPLPFPTPAWAEEVADEAAEGAGEAVEAEDAGEAAEAEGAGEAAEAEGAGEAADEWIPPEDWPLVKEDRPVRAALAGESVLFEDGGAGARVLVIPVHGDIDAGLSAFMARALREAGKVDLVIVDINTPGGRVDMALEMSDLLMSVDGPTVAYINREAISAGTLIALSCNGIAMADGGTIGASAVVSYSEGEANPVEEKYTSFVRTKYRSVAFDHGRNPGIAEAMVDEEFFIRGVIAEGKLLTLDVEGAEKQGFADGRARDLDVLRTKLGLTEAEVLRPEMSVAERVARFLTNPVVGGLLMTIGMLGIGIELYSPGVGLPGAVGVICLTLFFFSHFLVHLAGLEVIVLIGIGVILLLVEVFVTPGFGVAGIAGLAVMGLGLVLALLGLDLDVAFKTGYLGIALLRVFASFGVAVMAFSAFLYFAPESRFAKRLVLKEKVRGTVAREGRDSEDDGEDDLLGQEGVAVGDLRPAGIARFGEQRVDVVTEGDYIPGGSRVRVIEVLGNRVVVRAIEVDN